MVAVLAIALLAQAAAPDGPIFTNPAQMQRRARAFPYLFEFAPTDGLGMGASCACAAVKGTRGETITFTRSSGATCMKGGLFTGIANGDMVTCSSNDTPRVMPGGTGTGSLGLMIEAERTNSTLRSEEFDNAAWAVDNTGSSNPVVTANAAAAPDGTTTADRIQVPATTSTNFSRLMQASTACPAGADSWSIFVKGVSGSGTLDFVVGSGADRTGTPCAYVSTSWTRCVLENKTMSANANFMVGSLSVYSGAGAIGAAADAYIWGAQCEAGAYATSYIKTVGSTATRAQERASFAAPSGFSNTAGCIGMSALTYKSTGTRQFTEVAGRGSHMIFLTNTAFRVNDGTTDVNATASSSMVGRLTRGIMTWTGSTLGANTDGQTGSGSYDGNMGASSGWTIGSYDLSGDFRIDGVMKGVAVNTTATGCALP